MSVVSIELPFRPDLAALHAAEPQRFPALLASQSCGTPRARWDLLFISAGSGFFGGAGQPIRDLATGDAASGPSAFLDHLDRRWRDARDARVDSRRSGQTGSADLPPFRGGWLLLLGYELAAEIEPKLRLPPATDGTPPGLAIRVPAALAFDHLTGVSTLLHEAAAELPEAELSSLIDSIRTATPDIEPAELPDLWVEQDPPAKFTSGVRRVLDYLAAGDAFQVNLSRGWRLRPAEADAATLDPARLYRRLASVNPAPFAASLHGPGFTLISSSPERLVAVRGARVETRPIAGTRPRVAGDDDASRMAELVGHPKERAEHIMLIDLERNDLGRICRPGTVTVEELMAVESYAHVHHIESTVAGLLRAEVGPVEVIRALFPGGTITGCPKVRCMEIIAELEGEGRGAYTGAIGYLNHDGDMDLNILIRTLVWDGQVIRLRAGAGIVADSDPDAELAETRAKAHGLLRGLGVEQ